jgi:hypothetical protein
VKAARVRLSTKLLAEALGFPVPWTIVHAHVLHTHWERPVLELILTGDTLDEAFAVEEGAPIHEAEILVTCEQRTAQIVPVHPAPVASHART